MFSELLLRDARPKIVRTADGGQALQVFVRLNWYRSVPLSCVEELDLQLDGVKLATDGMTLEIGSDTVPVASLVDCEDVWWFPLDQACLTAVLPASIDPRAEPRILRYGIKTRIPYFLPRPDGTWGTLNDVSTMEVTL